MTTTERIYVIEGGVRGELRSNETAILRLSELGKCVRAREPVEL